MSPEGRIASKFAELHACNHPALMPFITAGDPDLDFTADLLIEFQKRGAAMIELGIPFSDPVADGPVIQSSYTRALGNGLKLKEVFDWMRTLRPSLEIPVVTKVSYSIVYRKGPERYVTEAKDAGFDGAIVPDLPPDEGDALIHAARAGSFDTIFLVAPTTPANRRRQIVANCTGFVYYVSVTGITGARESLPDHVIGNIDDLKTLTDLPICVGFGVSNPMQAQLLARHADGVIVGSAIVKMLEKAKALPRKDMIEKVGAFVGELVKAAAKGGQALT